MCIKSRQQHLMVVMMISLCKIVLSSTNYTTTLTGNHIGDPPAPNLPHEGIFPYYEPTVNSESSSGREGGGREDDSSDEEEGQTTSVDYRHMTAFSHHPLPCPPPPNIPFAQTNLKNLSYYVGTEATYSCLNGYNMTQGSNIIKCISPTISSSSPKIPSNQRAYWETPTLVCQIVNCGDPGFVENADRIAFNFNYNSNVSYVCKPNYRMSGVPFLLCTKEGRWNRDRPRCDLIKCPSLKIGDGDLEPIYSSDKHEVGSKVTFKCPIGKHIEGNEVINCLKDGKWNASIPKCVRNTCRLVKPHSGVLVLSRKDKYYPGDVAILRCHNLNKKAIKCLADGTWQGELDCPEPEIKLCPPLSQLENGRHNGSIVSSGYPDGSVITFSCNPNYYRIGAPYIRCRHGIWSSSKPRCALHEFGSLSRTPSSSNQLTVLGTVLFVILFLVLLVLSIILHRLRQRHLEKQYWKRYFGNHTYRQSRTNITATCNQEMRFFRQSRSPVPVTDL